MDFDLTDKQYEAYLDMKNGLNIFITGPAGTGKSFLLNKFIEDHNDNKEADVKKTLYITSLTGISAQILKGTTLHSFAGIGLGNNTIDYYVNKIRKNSEIYHRWKQIETLIIDEVSMLTSELYEKLELLARLLRKNDKPFGGIQIILSGDFLQLPPVNSDNFCFESSVWKAIVNKTYYFEKIIRQSNTEFQNVLNKIRIGVVDEEVKNLLDSRLIKNLSELESKDTNIKPTILLSKKDKVKEYNFREQEKLLFKNTPHKYTKKYIYVNIKEETKEMYHLLINKIIDIDDNQIFTIGSQVMLVVNKPDDGLANGSLGKIIGFNNNFPIVKFLNGVEKRITKHTWSLQDEEKQFSKEPNIKVEQIPLIPAWAITIHRAQGSTLEYVLTDIGNSIFEYGQAYVVLSRIKKIEGLQLLNINYSKIRANPKILAYYESLNEK